MEYLVNTNLNILCKCTEFTAVISNRKVVYRLDKGTDEMWDLVSDRFSLSDHRHTAFQIG
jgi:hypothetical protein